MIKKKLAAIAAAAVAACSITATAFADVGFEYDSFGATMYTNSEWKLPNRSKNDSLEGVVYISDGLESGNTFLTFYINREKTNAPATNEYDLWVNGRLGLPYKSGQGIEKEKYALVIAAEPQANADRMSFGGKWAP